jgi:serine/threonine protein kinase
MAKHFDNWQVIQDLSQGGQAWTYLVTKADGDANNLFVLKRLIRKTDPSRIKRFQQEIDMGMRLDHPNILKVVAHNIDHEHPYLVTEYCAGGSLADLTVLDYTDGERLKLFLSISRGVGYAHDRGVIHRDLKPANIFLLADRKTPVVGDFGLCLLSGQEERLTEVNEAVGARWYMAPELEDGLNVDVNASADVYSLGKILYWMFAGKIFSRERHRIPQYGLTTVRRDSTIHLIYDLLDGMIVTEPTNRRFRNGDEVSEAVENMIRRAEMNAHHIDISVPQVCSYCGIGFYQKIVDESPETNRTGEYPELARFGLRGLQRSSWLIFACDYCGNIQLFRRDYAKDRNIWRENKRT